MRKWNDKLSWRVCFLSLAGRSADVASYQYTFVIVAAASALAVSAAFPAFADVRCHQLEALSQQYAGVELTPAQKQMKWQMVVWYEHNCRTSRSAKAN